MNKLSGSIQPTAEFLRNALGSCPLIAVLRWITPQEAEGVAEVLIEEGFQLIEVPLNSPEPCSSIERLSRRFGDTALIGAGTVVTPEQVIRVGQAGGRLVVMPHADITVIRAAKEQGFACFPGVATPTEAFAALAAGADGLKIFPAEAISPAVLKAWRAVFAKEIPLMPTGGITPAAMAGWVHAGASGFGMGGNLYAPGRLLGDIRMRARAYVAAWQAASGGRQRTARCNGQNPIMTNGGSHDHALYDVGL